MGEMAALAAEVLKRKKAHRAFKKEKRKPSSQASEMDFQKVFRERRKRKKCMSRMFQIMGRYKTQRNIEKTVDAWYKWKTQLILAKASKHLKGFIEQFTAHSRNSSFYKWRSRVQQMAKREEQMPLAEVYQNEFAQRQYMKSFYEATRAAGVDSNVRFMQKHKYN